MDMQELITFTKQMHNFFIEKEKSNIDWERQSLLRSMKLTEEVGELNEQILGHYGYGRKEKIDKCDTTNLEHEIADVIICTCILAESLGVDVQKALKNKIKKIKARIDNKKNDRAA